jgi:hypothetical protein
MVSHFNEAGDELIRTRLDSFGGDAFLKEARYIQEQTDPVLIQVMNFLFLTNGQDAWVVDFETAQALCIKRTGQALPPSEFFKQVDNKNYGLIFKHALLKLRFVTGLNFSAGEVDQCIRFLFAPFAPPLDPKEDALPNTEEEAEKLLEKYALLFEMPRSILPALQKVGLAEPGFGSELKH